MMLDPVALSRAVDLQDRSYQLLLWMADAVKNGFIKFTTAHNYGTLPEACENWIISHYSDIPHRARPDKSDLIDFSRLFTSYLTTSFDLRENPGKQLYSPDAHCFCPMCSWLVDAPNLKTKKITASDRKRARSMKVDVVQRMGLELGVDLTDKQIDEIVNAKCNREPLSMVAYAHSLIDRLNGKAVGPATLVLWRGFAWTESGSPKKKLSLSADEILESERRLVELIQKAAKCGSSENC